MTLYLLIYVFSLLIYIFSYEKYLKDLNNCILGYFFTIILIFIAGFRYNISTDYRVTMGELLALLQELCGTNAPVETAPELYRPTDASQKLDCTKLCKHTGWQCDYDLKQTLRDIISAL